MLGADFAAADPAETQEDPQDMYWGEAWAATLIQAVLDSKTWSRTLLVYIYDEHGGYYDHVPPPAAIAPDTIPPKLQPGDPPGAYNVYGPRVPAVVVSPYSAAGRVTSVIHDHTSVLATIEAQVEPAGAHRPGRERQHRHGLPGPRSRASRRDHGAGAVENGAVRPRDTRLVSRHGALDRPPSARARRHR